MHSLCVRSGLTKCCCCGSAVINRNTNKRVATKHNISFEMPEVHIQEMTGLHRVQFSNIQLVQEERTGKIEGRHLASLV
jgi:hypothetical protein